MNTAFNYLALAVEVAASIQSVISLLKSKTPITPSELSTAIMPSILAIQSSLNITISPVAVSDIINDAVIVINKYNVNVKGS